jgi:hypothetical protein
MKEKETSIDLAVDGMTTDVYVAETVCEFMDWNPQERSSCKDANERVWFHKKRRNNILTD